MITECSKNYRMKQMSLAEHSNPGTSKTWAPGSALSTVIISTWDSSQSIFLHHHDPLSLGDRLLPPGQLTQIDSFPDHAAACIFYAWNEAEIVFILSLAHKSFENQPTESMKTMKCWHQCRHTDQ